MWLPISVFLIVTVFVYGLARLSMRGGKNREEEVLSAGRRRSLIFGPLTGALAGVIPSSSAAKTRVTKELRRAGYYHRLAYEEFASLRNALVVGWVIFVGTLIVVVAEPNGNAPVKLALAGLAGTVLLYGLPRLLLRSQAAGRVRRIGYALPDALDMITMCMTGGLPLEQAIARVSKELGITHPDLACELRILSRQTQAGSLTAAIRQFADRIDTPDVRSLSAMVNQTGSQGTGAADVFEGFADGVRRDQRQRAEEQGNKTTVKMLFPLVFCLAPPIYMLLLTPAVIELRAFLLQENRPGGVLSPSVTAEENVENLAERFSYLPFAGRIQQESNAQAE